MRVLTPEQMAAVDRRAIEELGIPGMVLMENAALGVVQALAETFPRAETAAILCGPGNNGGDGLAVARHLVARGYGVEVFLVRGGKEPSGDAGTQLAICRNMGIPVEDVLGEDDLAAPLAAAEACDLVVDALFGTGLSRPLSGHFGALVEGLAGSATPVLAVDLPSGLGAGGPSLSAELTVTFAALKVAHLLGPGAASAGQIVIADLGLPPSLVEEAPGNLSMSTAEEMARLLPARPRDGHKGTFGHLLLVAGGRGKSGAAVLAARAAVRSGAGLVTCAVPEPVADAVDRGSVESMTWPLPLEGDGSLGSAAVKAVLEAAEGKAAVALGPGLGTAGSTPASVRRLVRDLGVPLVLDADGINAFAGKAGELRDRPAPTVLTPHPGELGRLMGMSTQEITSDRLEAVQRAAQETGCVLLLKGASTLVADPAGPVAVNPTGNAGMATGGTGDVLTGMIGALLAQGMDPFAAARAGAYLHGLAGDLAAERIGERALAAGDVVDCLGEAQIRLEAP